MNLTTLCTLINNHQAYFDGFDEVLICIELTSEATGEKYINVNTRACTEGVQITKVLGITDDNEIMVDCIYGDDDIAYITLYTPLEKHFIEQLVEEIEED